MYAIKYNRLEMVQELIRAGAALDVQDNNGDTALMWAVQNNRLEMVQELIRASAALDLHDPLDPDKNGKTALMYAALTNSLEIVKELIRAGAALDLQDNDGYYTALMWAVKFNHLEIVQELIRAGAAIDVQAKYGDTALMILVEGGAAKYESVAIAAMLLEAGARCPGYKRSGVFNSKCKICHESKNGHNL